MAATLQKISIYIESKDVFRKDNYWWVAIKYSDGGEDEYGPFDEKEQAQMFV